MKALLLISIGMFSINISSCARNNTASTNPIALATPTEPVPMELKKTSWIDSIHAQSWRWMYGKYTTNYTDGSRSFSFKTSLKCSKDSAINALVSFASIPIFNALATPDSLFYVNKKDRCFGKQPIASFKELLGVELSMKNIQELFLGLPLGYKDSTQYTSEFNVRGDSTYMSGKLDGGKPIEYRYCSSLKSPRLSWQRLFIPEDLTAVIIQYDQWVKHGLMDIPSLIHVSIKTKEQNIRVILTYDKFELNSPQEIYIQIPDDYAPCK
jgi:hypothetical protein